MQDAYGRNQTRAYLAQRIENASAEELAAMLLEGAERFLTQAAEAIRRKDIPEKTRLVNRVAKIMQRMLGMLNPEADRNLVDKLHGIYIWWIKEMFEGCRNNRADQLERVVFQMDDLRRGWSRLATQAKATMGVREFSAEGMVG